MTEYRITSNGIKFRIEWLCHRRFLWWRWSKWKRMWKPDGAGGFVEAQYDTIDDAERVIKRVQAHDVAEALGWIPVTSSASTK